MGIAKNLFDQMRPLLGADTFFEIEKIARDVLDMLFGLGGKNAE